MCMESVRGNERKCAEVWPCHAIHRMCGVDYFYCMRGFGLGVALGVGGRLVPRAEMRMGTWIIVTSSSRAACMGDM